MLNYLCEVPMFFRYWRRIRCSPAAPRKRLWSRSARDSCSLRSAFSRARSVVLPFSPTQVRRQYQGNAFVVINPSMCRVYFAVCCAFSYAEGAGYQVWSPQGCRAGAHAEKRASGEKRRRTRCFQSFCLIHHLPSLHIKITCNHLDLNTSIIAALSRCLSL